MYYTVHCNEPDTDNWSGRHLNQKHRLMDHGAPALRNKLNAVLFWFGDTFIYCMFIVYNIHYSLKFKVFENNLFMSCVRQLRLKSFEIQFKSQTLRTSVFAAFGWTPPTPPPPPFADVLYGCPLWYYNNFKTHTNKIPNLFLNKW